MLQGVVARGTARAIGTLSPYVAGKTGTTEDAVDGWFIGFTNDVTIAVWVGYDNSDGKRRSLGTNATGARVALPIFEPILQAVWAEGIAPKALLNGQSPEAKRHLADLPIDYYSGSRTNGGGRAFVEHFRLDADGHVNETQYQLVSREEPYPPSQAEPDAEQDGWRDRGWDDRGSAAEQGWGAWGWGRRDAQPAPEQRFSELSSRVQRQTYAKCLLPSCAFCTLQPLGDTRCPFFWRAIVLKVRTCSAVHARRFLACFAIEQVVREVFDFQIH
jgi:hypothetical protein